MGSAAQGGDLGYVNKGMNSNPEVEQTIFSLKMGEYSQPIKTDFGYQIIKVDEIKPEVVKPYSEVKDELKKNLQRSRAEAAFSALTDELLDLTNDDLTDLQPVATQLGVQLQKTEMFSRENIPPILQSQNVQSLLFDPDFIELGYNSEVMEAGKDQLIVFRVRDYIPEASKPLSDVRGEIVQTLTAMRAQDLASDRAQTYVAQLKQGGDIAQLAGQEGWSYKQASEMQRNQAAELPPMVVDSAFSMPRPEGDAKTRYAWVKLANGDTAVIALFDVASDVDPAATQAIDSELRTNIQSLESQLATDHMKYSADINRYPENF